MMLRGILVCLCLASLGGAKRDTSNKVVFLSPEDISQMISNKWLVLFTCACPKCKEVRRKFLASAEYSGNPWLLHGYKVI